MNNICVVTKCSYMYNKMNFVTAQNKILYCMRHGYGFYQSPPMYTLEKPGNWYKWNAIKEASKLDYKWLFWSDTDSVFMNLDIPLSQFVDDKYMFINCTYPKKDDMPEFYIHLGNFFIKNNKITMEFLRQIYEEPEDFNALMTDEEEFTNRYNKLSDPLKRTFKFLNTRMFITIPGTRLRKLKMSKNLDGLVYHENDFILHAINEQSNFTVQERTDLLDGHLKKLYENIGIR